MAYVLKIKYESILRRVILKPQSATGSIDISFEELEAKIRYLFAIPPSVGLVLTYKDKDGDAVTIARDEDLEDALVIQGLNPLKIEVTSLEDNNGKAKSSTGLNGQSSSSPAIDIPRLAEILEKSLLPKIDSVKKIASEHLKNLSEKLESDGNFPRKTLSDLLQALNKEILGDKNVTFNDGEKDLGSDPGKETGNCNHPSSDPTAEIKQPNQFQSSNDQGRHEADGVFHHGIQCDGCGTIPIVGPRYKSLKHHDYDLCSTCFNDSKAAEADYVRYEEPARFHGGRHFSGFHGGKMSRCPYIERSMFGRPACGSRSAFRGNFHGRHESRAYNHSFSGKLDGRFVRDVTIFDGTELAPGTSFTKIWKLRNSGTLPWPQNTQLVHVGGDALGPLSFALLELGEGGLLPDEEIEVSVDLVAPENSGRYISHWRLITPSGVKFGHRVWVSIQVVSKDEQSPQILESLKGDSQINPDHLDNEMAKGEADAELDGEKPMEVDEVVKTSSLNALSKDYVQDASASVVGPLETEEQRKIQADCIEKLPSESFENDTTMLENSELGAFSLVDAPQIANIEAQDVITKNAPSDASSLDVELLPESWNVQPAPAISKEETLLNQLETIGFRDPVLNLELLRKNNNDLQTVLDELFAAEKWEPLLNELQEMGFSDADLNLRLLFKHEGSLKHVVKELVQSYKASGLNNKV